MLVVLHTLILRSLIFLVIMYFLHFNNQVFDGHGGKDAAHFVRDNLPRVIVEDSDFPLQLEKVVRRSFMQIDCQFAEKCSHHRALSSGTTALTAMIFGRYFPVTSNNDAQFYIVYLLFFHEFISTMRKKREYLLFL